MKAYILAATAIVFFTVILSVLLPSGKLGKTVGCIGRIACIVCFIQPITTLVSSNSSVSTADWCEYDVVCNAYARSQQTTLANLLKVEFGVDATCEVDITYENGTFNENGVIVWIDNFTDTGTINDDAESANGSGGTGEAGFNLDEIRQKIYAYLENLGYIHITVNG